MARQFAPFISGFFKKSLVLNPVTFANLPSTPKTGEIAVVSDSNTTTWGATIAGSSTNKVLAFYNGTNWTVAGA